jgi:uncharacterized membrane protein
MLALVRSGAWEWALLFHVLGAFLTIGGMTLVSAVALAAGRSGSLELRRLTFRALLVVVLPAFVLMRVAAEWVRSEDPFPDDLGWLGVGYIVTDAGVVLLLAMLVLGWLNARAARRAEPRDHAAAPRAPFTTRILAVLAPLYLLALLVAVWAMTTKPD